MQAGQNSWESSYKWGYAGRTVCVELVERFHEVIHSHFCSCKGFEERKDSVQNWALFAVWVLSSVISLVLV